MALIKCPNCHKDVSSMITHCPFCNTDLTQVKVFHQQENIYYDSNHPTPVQEQDLIFNAEDSFFDNEEMEQAATTDSYSRPTGFNNSSSHSANSRTDSQQENAADAGSSQRKRKKQAPPGRRLFGYRSGSFVHMLFSMCYYMAAAVAVLFGLSLSPQYLDNGTLFFHLCRVLLAALMLFLPALLLSDTKTRKKIPLFCSRKKLVVVTGLLLVYIPLAALFVLAWRSCS